MVFRKHLALRKNKFLIGHRWLPHFSEHTGQAECIRVQSKTPIKFNRSKKPSNRNIPRKEWSGEIHKHFWLRNFWRKKEKINKRFTGKSWKQFTFEPCYTCEKTSQLSYKSRVLHSILVVRACGGIFERGGSRNSHYFAYLHTFVDKKYVIGDGYYTCVPIRMLFQKGYNSATLIWDEKIYISSQDVTLNFQQVDFYLSSFLSRRGY